MAGRSRVRLRMGLHTGRGDRDRGRLYGRRVHRAARVSAAGHGGQILVSETTAALSRPPSCATLARTGSQGCRNPSGFTSSWPTGCRATSPASQHGRQLGNAMKVVIAEDSVLLREGVARLLEEAGFDVVAQSGTAGSAAARRDAPAGRRDRRHPHAADAHRRGPRRGADDQRASTRRPASSSSRSTSRPAMRSTAHRTSAEGVGYLLKDRVADLRGVRERGASGRRRWLGPRPGRRQRTARRATRDEPLDELTPREREVLELMAEGRSNQAIADRMFVTLRAVEKHVTSIFTKLDLPASDGRPPPRARGARLHRRLSAAAGGHRKGSTSPLRRSEQT